MSFHRIKLVGDIKRMKYSRKWPCFVKINDCFDFNLNLVFLQNLHSVCYKIIPPLSNALLESLHLFMHNYLKSLIEWNGLFSAIEPTCYNKLTWIRCISITNLVENPIELHAIKRKIFNYIRWYLYSIDFDRFSPIFPRMCIPVTMRFEFWFKQSLCINSFSMRTLSHVFAFHAIEWISLDWYFQIGPSNC